MPGPAADGRRRSGPPDDAAPLPRWQDDGWQEEGDYEGLAMPELALSVPSAHGARFHGCLLGPGTVGGGDLGRSTWRATRVTGVRLVGVGLARSSWRDVVFEECALSGCELYGADLRQVTFTDCTLDSVNLRGAKLREVTFAGCRLVDVDLGSSTLTRCSTPGSVLDRLELSHATFDQVDLRGARLSVAHGVEALRGAVIDHVQLAELAPALAGYLGIAVRMPGDDRSS